MLGWHDARPLQRFIPATEARALKRKFGFASVEDLLFFRPRKYIEHGSSMALVSEMLDGEVATILGEILSVTPKTTSGGKFLLSVRVFDGTQYVTATFFNQRYLSNVLQPGMRVMFTGKVRWFRDQASLQHPDMLIFPQYPGAQAKGTLKSLEAYGSPEQMIDVLTGMPHLPIYPAKAGVPTWRIFGAVHAVLGAMGKAADPLGRFAPTDLPTFDAALRGIHEAPEEGPWAALQRMKYNEALEITVSMRLRRLEAEADEAPPLKPQGSRVQQLVDNLDYQLTEGQNRVVADISADLAKPHPMSRLLQGEVGSGKTIVSIIAMLQAVDAGFQAALLAPTEVLATQHARGIAETLERAGVDAKVVLLCASLNTEQKRQALLDILSGDADIVVGTHAIIQEKVEFFNLGLSVVDEQHRFGVEQRNILRTKGREGLTPHLLVMTATPIPRTIAMTAFGDLSLSVLDELPGGRRPIETVVVDRSLGAEPFLEAMRHIWREVKRGHQAYVVCPRIEDIGGVLHVHEYLSTQLFREMRTEVLHGQMHPEDKDEVMRRFAAGEVDILVATTVIEVGIDVPNATVMYIQEAERFGISQLHQLRGRVGRGGNQSRCYLGLSKDAGEVARERITTVAEISDGFVLSEADLRQRQEGDVTGARQAGSSHMLFLDLADDLAIIERAGKDAEEIVAADPEFARGLVRDLEEQQREYLEKA